MPKPPGEEKHYFAWSTVYRRQTIEPTGKMFASITRDGLLYIPKSFVDYTGYKKCWVKILFDLQRRSIGFKFYDKLTGQAGRDLRRFTPSEKLGSAFLSVGTLLEPLGIPKKTKVSYLELKKYTDSIYGDMWTITVPRQKKSVEENQVVEPPSNS